MRASFRCAAAALTRAGQDPAFLESLIPGATRITQAEGQAATVTLGVIVR
jgi:hypothetical protein